MKIQIWYGIFKTLWLYFYFHVVMFRQWPIYNVATKLRCGFREGWKFEQENKIQETFVKILENIFSSLKMINYCYQIIDLTWRIRYLQWTFYKISHATEIAVFIELCLRTINGTLWSNKKTKTSELLLIKYI